MATLSNECPSVYQTYVCRMRDSVIGAGHQLHYDARVIVHETQIRYV